MIIVKGVCPIVQEMGAKEGETYHTYPVSSLTRVENTDIK